MTPQISITHDSERFHLDGPYSFSNRKLWTAMNGKYTGVWSFPRNKVVERALEERFGSPSGLCKIHIPGEDMRIERRHNQWQVGGYVIATKRVYNGEVICPDGVHLIEGEWSLVGGTQRNPMPMLKQPGRSTIEMVVRVSFAKREGFEILEEDETYDPVLANYTVDCLQAEIDRRNAVE
jgi:hypothetical protein